MEDKTVQLTTYLQDSLYAKLKALADADKRSISYMIALGVSELVAKSEAVVSSAPAKKGKAARRK